MVPHDADAGTPRTLQTIADLLSRHGALLTTEKDWINLGEDGPEKIYWLKIRIEIDDEETFLRCVDQCLGLGNGSGVRGLE